jgi:hypothetical protein
MNRIIRIMVIVVCILVIPLLAFSESLMPVSYSSQKSKKLEFGFLGVSARGIYNMPIADVLNVLNGGLGPEVAITYRSFLFKNFHLVAIGDYTTYTGKVNSDNKLSTINVKLLGRYDVYPLEDLASFIPSGVVYVNLGGGVSFETLTMPLETINNIDPIFQGGIGYELGLMKDITLNIGVNYIMLYEKVNASADKNGSFISFSLGLNYEFGGKRR